MTYPYPSQEDNIPRHFVTPLSRGEGCRTTQATTGEMEGITKVPARDTEYRQGLQTPVYKESSTSNPAGVAVVNMLISATPAGLRDAVHPIQG